jgi:hypothetical protein
MPFVYTLKYSVRNYFKRTASTVNQRLNEENIDQTVGMYRASD